LTTTRLMTVDEFRKLEDPPGEYLELHNGEVVALTRPKMKHHKLQVRLVDILGPILAKVGKVCAEQAFRAVPEYDLRVADVALVRWDRWAAAEDDLFGSPELVIEVESPSNTARELKEKASLCFAHGCQEFWTVYPDLRLIEVTQPSGRSQQFKSGEFVQSTLFASDAVAVDAIFAKWEV
jgi:Uma2 family endonuclease